MRKHREACEMLSTMPLEELGARCAEVRKSRFGDKVDLCAIISARQGSCPEDCSFCAQSQTAGAGDSVQSMELNEMRRAHESATEAGITRFSAVTSGRGLSGTEFDRICRMAWEGRHLCPMCASLGILTKEQMKELKDSGITRYHHNLESSESYFQEVCSTHTWEERYRTVQEAMSAGLSVCSGGIMGIGESDEHRVDLALTLKELEVDSVALNFYLPVPGARVAAEQLSPGKMLRIIAMFRLLNPEAELRLCAGWNNLGALTDRMFDFGATGIMTGALLTTRGSIPEDDAAMIEKSGYQL